MGWAMGYEMLSFHSVYWNLFRYAPRKVLAGENPLTIDMKEPSKDYDEFIMGENRYINLQKKDPERAEKLFGEAKANAKKRYEKLVKLSQI